MSDPGASDPSAPRGFGAMAAAGLAGGDRAGSPVWAFDVDGTLIGSIRSDVLRPHAVALLEALVARNVTCVLWSAGGQHYASEVARRHGIHHLVAAYYGKDERDGASRYRVDHFEPAHAPEVFVDDAPDDLPIGATVIAVAPFFGGNPADGALAAVLATLDVARRPDRSND